jgi:organic radical activating enzyme
LKEQDDWYIEIETNCTIVPDSELSSLVDQFNVSPKLANSKNNILLSLKEDAIKFFAQIEHSCFKFVTSDNIDEIKSFVDHYQIAKEKVYLMAEGFERFAQVEQVEKVLKWCVENGYNYGPRLHTLLWGNRRGV